MSPTRSAKDGLRHPRSRAFLLAQIGAHAARRFAERLSQVRMSPAHAGILRIVAATAGISQQELAGILGMVPSGLVPLIDELETRGLLERRDSATDRRVYALHLTGSGSKLLADVGRIAQAHDDEICAALTAGEREELGRLLRKIADERRLTPGVHPGFARVGKKTK